MKTNYFLAAATIHLLGSWAPVSRAFSTQFSLVKFRRGAFNMQQVPTDENVLESSSIERNPLETKQQVNLGQGDLNREQLDSKRQEELGITSFFASQTKRNSNVMPQFWSGLSRKAKDDVKSWFIDRGNKKGVPFSESIALFRSHRADVWENFERIFNDAIEYPDYYLQTFHGYEDGNLNWEAAEDCLPATLSMSLGYWPGVKPLEAQGWFRKKLYRRIKGIYLEEQSVVFVESERKIRVVDVGGSVGVNTKVFLDAFPGSKVAILDLSPYFLATAKMLLTSQDSPIYHEGANARVSFHHGLAEAMPFDNDSMDIVTIPFVMHELPAPIAERVIRESMRVLRPGGVLSILELDRQALDSLPALRRFLFGITEPHVEDYVTGTNITSIMKNAGFANVCCEKNDPMNSRWMGMKPVT